MKLKPNTKLRCIDASNQKVLNFGEIYTVSDDIHHKGLSQKDGRVFLNEWKRFSFLISRFEVIED
jgi:hypothetical protein